MVIRKSPVPAKQHASPARLSIAKPRQEAARGQSLRDRSAFNSPQGVHQLFALPSGGFEIRDPSYRDRMEEERGNVWNSPLLAAFSTLGEALTWLGENMAQPVRDAQTKP